MLNEPQFIATPSPLDYAVSAASAVMDSPAAPQADIMASGNQTAMAHTDSEEHKTLREQRLEYWKGKSASPEYLRSKKFDKSLAEEAGGQLDANGKISAVTPEILTNLEEKMYVYIEQARRNLEESRRFDSSEKFSPAEIIERLQKVVSSDPESSLHKKVVAAITDKSATMGSLHDLLVESETSSAYDCLEKAHEIAGLLNDIASGHASRSLIEEHARENNLPAPPQL